MKFVTNPANGAGRAALIAAALVVSMGAPLAADGDRAVRMAKYARPAGIPFPADNPYTPEKAELGRMLS